MPKGWTEAQLGSTLERALDNRPTPLDVVVTAESVSSDAKTGLAWMHGLQPVAAGDEAERGWRRWTAIDAAQLDRNCIANKTNRLHAHHAATETAMGVNDIRRSAIALAVIGSVTAEARAKELFRIGSSRMGTTPIPAIQRPKPGRRQPRHGPQRGTVPGMSHGMSYNATLHDLKAVPTVSSDDPSAVNKAVRQPVDVH